MMMYLVRVIMKIIIINPVHYRGAQAGLSPGTDREVRTILEIMARCVITIIIVSIVIIVLNVKANS